MDTSNIDDINADAQPPKTTVVNLRVDSGIWKQFTKCTEKLYGRKRQNARVLKILVKRFVSECIEEGLISENGEVVENEMAAPVTE